MIVACSSGYGRLNICCLICTVPQLDQAEAFLKAAGISVPEALAQSAKPAQKEKRKHKHKKEKKDKAHKKSHRHRSKSDRG